MSEKEEIKGTGKKVNEFLEKNRKVLLICCITFVVVLAAFLIFEGVKTYSTNKGLSALDSIFYQMTQGSAELEESELDAKRNEFIESLKPYTNKSGIVGVRANLICAELSYQKKDYANAITYWNLAERKGKKYYTAPISSFNKAVCYEQLGDLDNALAAYKLAAENEDYILKNHAKFSYGRILETQGKFAEAAEVYTKLNDDYPDDKWALLAKTRLLTLGLENKIQ
ncbi:MAG: tetratricopeptide repeat protein [Treponema sp.]|nr:tetratricopeptide repeat protein [Treponema sp.]